MDNSIVEMLTKMQEIQKLMAQKMNRSVSISHYKTDAVKGHCSIYINHWFNGDIPLNSRSITVNSIDDNAEHRINMMLKHWRSL